MSTSKIAFHLQNFWRSLGLSQAEAAKMMGITPQALCGQLSRPLSQKSALLYKRYWPELNLDFLLTGEGNVTVQNVDNSQNEPLRAPTSEPESIVRIRLELLEKEIAAKDQRIAELEKQVSNLISTINSMAMGWSQPGTPFTNGKGDEDFIHRR